MGAYLQADRQEDTPVLRTHLLGHIQQACPSEERGRQSGRDSRAWSGVIRCLPVGFDVVAMSDANAMRFSRIVERGLLSHQLGFPFLSAPRTDNLHRRSLNRRLADAKKVRTLRPRFAPRNGETWLRLKAAALLGTRCVPGQRVCLGRFRAGR